MFRFASCLAVTVCACFAQTSLTVSPQDLTFAVAAGSATPATASLAVGALGGNTTFTAAVRYLSNPGGWLNVTPQNGMTPATLTVTADASQLPPGTHSGQITIAGAGIARVVNVTLTVGASPANPGQLLVNPTAWTFIGAGEQTAPPAQIAVIAPPGTGPVTFRVATSTPWVSVPPGNFTTPATIPVVAYQTSLVAGVYNGSVSFIPVGGGAATVLPVVLKAAGQATAAYRLLLAQPSVYLNYLYGNPAPGYIPIGVATNIPTSQPNPYVAFTATTTTPWLKLSAGLLDPDTSTNSFAFGTGQDLKLHIDPSGLGPGTYSGSVVLTADGLPSVTLPVTLHVGVTPELNAVPSSVLLNDSTATGAVANVNITSTSEVPLGFTVATAADWLRASVSSYSTGTTGAILQLTYNAAGLTNGTYQSAVALSASNGSVLTIPVRLDLSNANAVQTTLTPNPSSLSFAAVRGQPNPTQILQIGTEYGRTHDFTVAANSTEGWLNVDTVVATAPTRILVTANLAVLPGAGSYSGAITLTSLVTNAVTTIPVSLQADNDFISVTPGQLTFTQPARFSAFTPQTIKIDSVTPNAVFRFLDVPAWLKVSDLSGAAPRPVTIWPEVSLLPPGSNQTVTLRIQGPKNTINLPVTVSLAAPPALTATPENVSLTYALGGPSVPSQTVKVETGTEPNAFSVKYTTENGRDWLKVAPVSAITPADLRVTIDPALVTTGRLNGTITVSLDNGSQTKTIPVVVAVNPPAAVVEAVLHGATQSPTPVAPGLMLTLTGNGFGSVNAITPKPTAAGAYETRVADTRVLFDGIPAAILYLRNDQINVIAPYSLYGRVSTRMQVEQGGNLWSLPVDLRVVDSQPGLFTAGGTGRGQASAVNQDFSPNSVLNPAERGSVITVFGTGEGQTDPPGQDGRVIATDLRKPLLGVTATIGGKPAEVLYAGSSSGMVSGTFQVNLRVPQDIDPGQVPVRIQVGSAVSPASVTVAVK